ncbi:MAG: fumarylacetoacetate hydrolase family protein [Thermoleophilia bacterium]|nr:fumarylacetoacetate hydrolase family protein [Thermoleophilia bacterium]
MAPLTLPRPTSIRDFMAFEEHVRNARARRGAEVPPEWYEAPTFYFTNAGPSALFGDGATVPKPDYTDMLDIELEVAVVIGVAGRDIPADHAGDHVAGLTIYGDWSARDVQRREMAVGLGPCKAKDFAQSLGPVLVPLADLEDRAAGRGRWDLAMDFIVNDERVGGGNLKDIHFDLFELVEFASQGVTLEEGDVLGSGTVGTGCLLEHPDRDWLQPGDRVELRIERLGSLRATVG